MSNEKRGKSEEYGANTLNLISISLSSGMSGFDAMLHELLQNADDAKDTEDDAANYATKFHFDVQDDKIVVGNNVEMQATHLKKIREIASGYKREDSTAIGKFGIGFVSVYQFCDTAFVHSRQEKWELVPKVEGENQGRSYPIENPVTQRFLTTFELPWAFEYSETRKGLGLQKIEKSDIQSYFDTAKEIMPHVIFFLRHLTTFILYRNSVEQIRIQKTVHEKNVTIVEQPGTAEEYFYGIQPISANSQAWLQAEELKQDKELGRDTNISVVMPRKMDHFEGKIFVFLPTDEATGLPFHINAGFYPELSRKRLEMKSGTNNEEWNSCVLKDIQGLILPMLEYLKNNSSHLSVYIFFSRVKDADTKSERYLKKFVLQYWEKCKEISSQGNWIYTESEKWENSSKVFTFNDKISDVVKHAIREQQDWHFPHPSLEEYKTILTSFNVVKFRLNHYLDALKSILTEKREHYVTFDSIKPFLETLKLFENDIDENSCKTLSELHFCISQNGTCTKISNLFYLDADSQAAYYPWFRLDEIINLEWYSLLPERLKKYIETHCRIRLDKTLERIAKSSSQDIKDFEIKYKDNWRLDNLISRLSCRIDPKIPEFLMLKELCIFPDAFGNFHKHNEVVIGEEFDDPFEVKVLLQKEFAKKYTTWLETIQIKPLKPDIYFNDQLLNYFKSLSDKTEKRHIFTHLSKHIDSVKMEAWKSVEIVFCTDENWRKPNEVWFPNEVMNDLFGSEYTKIHSDFDQVACSLLEKLGVRKSPTVQDVADQLKSQLATPISTKTREKRIKILEFLEKREEVKNPDFWKIFDFPWLPDENHNQWFAPKNLFCMTEKVFMEYGTPSGYSFTDFEIPKAIFSRLRFAEIKIRYFVDHIKKIIRDEKLQLKFLQRLNRFSEGDLGNVVSELKLMPLFDGFTANQSFLDNHNLGEKRHQLRPQHKELKRLIEMLGIKNPPGYQDYRDVVLEIAQSKKFTTEDRTVYDYCLGKLNHILAEPSLDSKVLDVLATLRSAKIIYHKFKNEPNCWWLPEEVIIDDLSKVKADHLEIDKSQLRLLETSEFPTLYEKLGIKKLTDVLTVIRIPTDNQEKLVVHEKLKEKLIEKEKIAFRILNKLTKLLEYKKIYQRLKASMVSEIKVRWEVNYGNEYKREISRVKYFFDEKINELFLTNEDIEIHEILCHIFDIEPHNRNWFVRVFNESITDSELEEAEFFVLKESEQNEGIPATVSQEPEVEDLDTDSVDDLQGENSEDKDINEDDFPIDNSQDEKPEPSATQDAGKVSSFSQSVETKPPPQPFPPELPIPQINNTQSQNRSSASSKSQEPNQTARRMPKTPPPNSSSQPQSKPQSKRSSKRRPVSDRTKVRASSDTRPSEDGMQRYITNKETEQIGFDAVVDFELSQKRKATDCRETWDGYDIYSEGGGEKRLIELKAIRGTWKERAFVSLSANEFRTAIRERKTKNYWLYVVEILEGSKPFIHRINNPGRAKTILFDIGWQELADQN